MYELHLSSYHPRGTGSNQVDPEKFEPENTIDLYFYPLFFPIVFLICIASPTTFRDVPRVYILSDSTILSEVYLPVVAQYNIVT